MHIKNYLTAFSAIMLVLLTQPACHHKKDKGDTSSPRHTAIADPLLMLTPDQVEMAGIETGKMETHEMGSTLECSGRIEVPPESIADVTVPVGGLVKSCPRHPGDYVTAGQLIAVLEHPDYIKMQQEFLETRSQWEYFKEDFKRQGELTIENATSLKTMQQAQASFRSIEVKMFALRNQLKLIGINADSLNIENISSTVNIAAPISGIITRIFVNIGKYVGPEQMVCEILSKANLYLQLFIYEKDIHRISKGQPIEFSLISDPGNRYKAVVRTLSPKIDPASNAFSINAGILQAQPFINPGMYVKAYISIAQHSCLSLPATAIVEDNNEQVVFVKTTGGFKRVTVKTGISNNDRVEIVDYPPGLSDSSLVLNGAYYLNAAWNDQQP